jgi:hypothetical protein
MSVYRCRQLLSAVGGRVTQQVASRSGSIYHPAARHGCQIHVVTMYSQDRVGRCPADMVRGGNGHKKSRHRHVHGRSSRFEFWGQLYLLVYYGLYYCIAVLLFIILHDHHHDLVLVAYSMVHALEQRRSKKGFSFMHDSAKLACVFVTGSREGGNQSNTKYGLL